MFLAFVLVSGSGAPKAFAHNAAYDLGWKSGLLDRGNGFHRSYDRNSREYNGRITWFIYTYNKSCSSKTQPTVALPVTAALLQVTETSATELDIKNK